MKYIVDYIVVLFSWIISLFTSLFKLIYDVLLIIVHCGQFLIDVLSSLPTIFVVPAIAIVICCVLYKVLGREGGEAN